MALQRNGADALVLSGPEMRQGRAREVGGEGTINKSREGVYKRGRTQWIWPLGGCNVTSKLRNVPSMGATMDESGGFTVQDQ